MDCELCKAEMALFGDENAFVRYDNNSLSKGHVLVIPRRHVADFFEMTWADDGRATFHYGEEIVSGHPHIVWRRVGSHEIFQNP